MPPARPRGRPGPHGGRPQCGIVRFDASSGASLSQGYPLSLPPFSRSPQMTIQIKTPEEIEKMHVAGRLAAEVLDFIAPHVKPGITTGELDTLCHDYMVKVQKRSEER